MAGEWVKMRVMLASDPQTIGMADYLSSQRLFMDWLTDPVRQSCKETAYEHVTRNVTARVTVSGLLLVWGIANDRGHPDGDDLILRPCTLDQLDEIAGIPCFGEAMAFVGWAREEDEACVRLPQFMTNNVTADERFRAKNAERQRRFRQKNSQKHNVTRNVMVKRDSNVTRNALEKRREEKRERRKEKTVATTRTRRVAAPARSSCRSRSADPIAWTPEEGWAGISDEDRASWAKAYPACDLDRQLEAMTQWLRANPEKARKKRWRRFLTSWLSRSQERGGDLRSNRPGDNGKGCQHPAHETEADRILADALARRRPSGKRKEMSHDRADQRDGR